MVPIFLSWIVSPVMSGIICSILFFFIRMFILRSGKGFTRAFYVRSPFVTVFAAWLFDAMHVLITCDLDSPSGSLERWLTVSIVVYAVPASPGRRHVLAHRQLHHPDRRQE